MGESCVLLRQLVIKRVSPYALLDSGVTPSPQPQLSS